MDFALNEDHLALRDAVQRFCDGEYPVEHRGEAETDQVRLQRWLAMSELGLLGLPFGAEAGGSDLGAVENMLVAQEFGKALGGGAWLSSTVLAGRLLGALASAAQQREYLAEMAAGRLQASVALYDEGARYDWYCVETSAQPQDSGYVINGRKRLVLDGGSADVFLVVARTTGLPTDLPGLSVFVVNAQSPGVTIQPFETLDNRRAAHVTFRDVHVPSAQLLGALGQAASAIEDAIDGAVAALCAEAAGAVEALIVHTADHLRTRKQFGAPLAKFQVLQHRLADMVIGLEQLKSMACAAAAALSGGDPIQRRRVISAAKAFAGQQGRQIGLSAIQLHGGMGMTDECRVGHYAKRLIVIGQLFGDAAWHISRMQSLAVPATN